MGEPDRDQPGADLAAMLAEMDSRLQRLQQELEAVALPIARSPTEQLRAKAAAEPAEPPAAAATTTIESELLSPAPRRPARRVGATARATPAPEAARPAQPVAPEQQPAAPAPARRARGRAVDPRPAKPAAGAPIARRPAAEPPPEPSPPETVVRETILEAEAEARGVVEEARQRIAEIGVRTRALLAHSLHEPAASEEPTAPRRRRARAVKAARRAYEGTVVVEAGPFADVAQLSAFEEALASIPAVDDVYIRTFEANRAHFELTVAAPTALIVELQARAEDTLNVLAAGDSELRLDIVRGAP